MSLNLFRTKLYHFARVRSQIRKLNLSHSLIGRLVNQSKVDERFLRIDARGFSSTHDDRSLESEELFWDRLKNSLELDELVVKNRLDKAPRMNEKSVFVLQLKMQYKSKPRQSTTADLQLAESISLVETLDNWRVVDWHIVGMKTSRSTEMFGSGNQETLSKRISSSGANCLFIVIDRLTNLQVENLRKTLLGNSEHIAIYDRYKIVLEIFKRNARSSIAKLQIALAEIPYIRHKFDNNDLYKNVEKKIKRELEQKLKKRNLLNAHRREKHLPLVSVFGYTNVGKTSFIKQITDDRKLKPENKLFATLDVTYHSAADNNSSQPIIYADTIGFISDIPHTLIESFKTSINDALDADLYLHLIDMSHPDRLAQQRTVRKILDELAPKDKLDRMITVYNKIDKLKQLAQPADDPNTFYVSCKTGSGLSELQARIERDIFKQLGYVELNLLLAQGGDELAFLYKNSIIREIRDNPTDANYLIANVLINKVNAIKFTNLFPFVKISK